MPLGTSGRTLYAPNDWHIRLECTRFVATGDARRRTGRQHTALFAGSLAAQLARTFDGSGVFEGMTCLYLHRASCVTSMREIWFAHEINLRIQYCFFFRTSARRLCNANTRKQSSRVGCAFCRRLASAAYSTLVCEIGRTAVQRHIID